MRIAWCADLPCTVRRTEEETVAGFHQGRDLVVHLADLVEQHFRVLVIFVIEQRMRGAVIGQQMPLGCDARENLGIGLGHLADDEERRLDVVLLENVENARRIVVGAVVEGERNRVRVAQARAEERAGLEIGDLRTDAGRRPVARGLGDGTRDQRHAEACRNAKRSHQAQPHIPRGESRRRLPLGQGASLTYA